MDSGNCGLWIADRLSPQTQAEPSIGTPIMRNLHCSPLAVSIPFSTATNSATNADVSRLGRRFENQISGAEFRNTKKPPDQLITGMIRIKMQTNFGFFTTRFGHFGRHGLFRITTELSPVALLLERNHVDLSVRRVKDDAGVVLLERQAKMR
jgi:hypothetical protein